MCDYSIELYVEFCGYRLTHTINYRFVGMTITAGHSWSPLSLEKFSVDWSNSPNVGQTSTNHDLRLYPGVVIVAFSQNATIEYSSESV